MTLAFAGDKVPDSELLPWKVNVFIDNGETDEIPIVAESVKRVEDLIGGSDKELRGSALYTNHMKIYPGLLARANGGYLILNLEDLAMTGAWYVLMSAIENGKFVPEGTSYFRNEITQMKPGAIPLNVRVVMFGSNETMERISAVFPSFRNIFKIRAAVLPFVERTKEQMAAYYEWIQSIAEEPKEKLHLPTLPACARLIEHASCLAGDQRRLSTHFDALVDVLRQANVLADRDGSQQITRSHIDQALKEKFWRSGFVYEYMQKRIKDGTFLIKTQGSFVGSINALTCMPVE